MTATAKTAPYGEASVTLTRVFDAPRALVWKAWTDSKMMAQWFGPRDSPTLFANSTYGSAAACTS